MSNLEIFAREELKRAGLFKNSSPYGGMMGHAVLKMIRQFAKEEHSDHSGELALQVFSRVARFEPLTPLTGADDEWEEVEAGVYQNRRCFHVFKENGQAYDQRGRVFQEASGATYTNRNSRVPVTFPYTPKTELVPDSMDLPV